MTGKMVGFFGLLLVSLFAFLFWAIYPVFIPRQWGNNVTN